MLLSIPYLSSCLVFSSVCLVQYAIPLQYDSRLKTPNPAPGKFERIIVGDNPRNGLSSFLFPHSHFAFDIALALTLRCIYLVALHHADPQRYSHR
ncbi:hypothetical protein C8F01DRAFT_1143844 [Mycena amicta]|nr:hypothetical protein C8F01DRAFT_1143844 [Mycena amicta]